MRERIQKISIVLWGLTIGLAITGLIFLLAPGWLIALFNQIGEKLGYFESLPPSPQFSQWNILSFAYMVLVSTLSGLAAWNPDESRLVLLLLIVGKITSSLLALVFFLVDRPALIYLTTFLTDGGIAVLALVCLRLVERKEPCPPK